jgi:hypothetical protein
MTISGLPAMPAPIRPSTTPTVARPGAKPTAGAAGAADPSLWSVLTDDERAFFMDSASLGPVSYGRGGATQQPAAAPLGQRIDVRG